MRDVALAARPFAAQATGVPRSSVHDALTVLKVFIKVEVNKTLAKEGRLLASIRPLARRMDLNSGPVDFATHRWVRIRSRFSSTPSLDLTRQRTVWLQSVLQVAQ
jgi:hypothetical protein